MSTPTKLSVIFYSMYGHVYKLTEAVIEGARSVQDVQVDLYRIPELTPDTILEKSGINRAQAAFAHIPIVEIDHLHDADGFIFGTPARFGSICSQMRIFLDGLHNNTTFVNKIGSAYTSFSAFPEIGPTLHASLLQLGMIIVGMPHAAIPQINQDIPNAATLTGDAKRSPSDTELAMARMQGKRVAETTKALKQGRHYV